MTTPDLLPDQANLSHVSGVLRALAHLLRLRMLAFIDQRESAMVHEIYQGLKIEQSITSQHLRILREADLVRFRRQGKFIRYRLHYDSLVRIRRELGKTILP